MKFIFPIIYSVIVSLLYASLYRIDVDFTKEKKAFKLIGGLVVTICILAIYTYLLPTLYIQFSDKILFPPLFFLKSDIWGFSFANFFPGILSLFPVISWFEAETHNNPLYKKKNNKGLAIFVLIVVFIPNLLVSRPFVELKADKIETLGYFSIFPEEYAYSQFKEFELESDTYTYTSKGNTRTAHKLRWNLVGDSQKLTIFDTDSPTNFHARKTAYLIQFLQTKKISYKDSLILYFGDWQTKLNKEREIVR